ncbi:MAG: gentisate 1,2-dioxygenase, partial [Burkholderiales bacterium]|nr:gentisate 1,2-dioxygenase [Burkholderiales bacterium]
VVWMDGLDIPMVSFFTAQFAENYPEDVQPVMRAEGDAQARYGANMVPLGPLPTGRTSPVFSYPNARSREVLETLSRGGAPDPCHGWKMQFINPLSGASAMPTIGSFIQLVPKGLRTRPYRATDGTVYSVVEGTGKAIVGDAAFAFEPRDTFVVPSWTALEIEAAGDCVLFSYSDRPAQAALGLWREQRG